MNNQENLNKLLVGIATIFRENNIEFFINHGTLLGYYRDKRLMPWDNDVDLGSLMDIGEPTIREKICYVLSKNGYAFSIRETGEWQGAHVISIVTEIESNFELQGNLEKGHLSIGLKFFKKISDVWIETASPVSYSLEAIKPLEQVSFLGVKVHIPNKPEEMFKKWYGDGWAVKSRRAWIMRPREKADHPEPIQMFHNQKMGYRASGVEEALLKCDNEGNYLIPYEKTGKTPR